MLKKCTALWREAHLEVKCVKNWGVRTAFGSWDVEKVHGVVARSTFRSQNVQNTPFSDHFWKLRCRKSARRCGAKHISKSKCTKHTILGPLLEVEMSKKCTPLWREAHFQVKMYKAHHSRTTFGSWDIEKVHGVVARSTFPSQNVENTPFLDHFWKLRCRKSARRCGAKHISKSKCTKHYGFGPLLEVPMWKKSTPLWREAHFEVKMLKTPGLRTTFGGSDVPSLRFTTLHYTTLHYLALHYTTLHYTTTTITQLHNYIPLHSTTLHYITLHYITLHYTTLHYTTTTTTQLHNYIPLHSTTLHYITLHYITLHYTALHYTTLRYLPLHFTTLNYTKLRYTTLHYITLHSTPLHYITLHYTTFHYTTLHYTTLHSTTLHDTTLHYLPLHFTTLHYTTLHYKYNYNYNYTTTLHYTTLHYTTLHSTTLHYTTLLHTTLHYTTTTTPTTQLHSTTLHYTKLYYITLLSTTLHYTTLHYITLNDTAPQIDR